MEKVLDYQVENGDQNYCKLFSSIRDAILIENSNHIIIDCNPAFIEIFGYERDEIVGKTPEFIYESNKHFLEMSQKLREQSRDSRFIDRFNYRNKSGEVFPGEINVYYVTDDDGETEAFVGIIRDISELKRVATERNTLITEQIHQSQKTASEVALAARIQSAMMEPPTITMPEVDVATRWIPASQMSGDFYNLEQLDIERLGLWLGDVSAKGVPAGLLMVLINEHLKADLFGNFVPGNVLSELNSKVFEFLSESENFSTLFLGVLNTRDGLLTYSDAGHGHAFIYRSKSNEIQTLAATIPPLGIQSQALAIQQEVGLNLSDMLIVYSDGITEARSSEGERFGRERLFEIVRVHGQESVDELRETILSAVAEFSEGADLSDDITLMIIHRRESPDHRRVSESMDASGTPLRDWTQGLTSHTGVLGPLHEWIARICDEVGLRAEHDPFVNACQLGISELVTNVIKHAYRGEHGRITVQAFEYGDRMEFIITDKGLPYETRVFEAEGLPKVREGQYGLMITRRVMDEVVYTRTPNEENVWRLMKRLPDAF
jgi:PAS domain S-box-containing protein